LDSRFERRGKQPGEEKDEKAEGDLSGQSMRASSGVESADLHHLAAPRRLHRRNAQGGRQAEEQRDAKGQRQAESSTRPSPEDRAVPDARVRSC